MTTFTKYIQNEEHYSEVISRIAKVRETLWIGTADIKDVYVKQDGESMPLLGQLAARIGISQPRIAKMELNERNLKISTMQKIAEGLDCDFVYGFVPKTSLQDTIRKQAQKKAAGVLSRVNATMALEDQLAQDPHLLNDLADEIVAKNIKQIWEE